LSVDNLHAFVEHVPFIIKEIVPTYGDNPIAIVSPDAGGVARAKMFMEAMTSMSDPRRPLNISLAITIKHRVKAGEIEGMNIVGEIKGKHCIIVDDMIDTAGTLTGAAKALIDFGATRVVACATHGVLSGPAIQRIIDSPLDEVVVSDTIPLSPAARTCSKIKQVSMARLLGEAIKRIHSSDSVSSLFA